MCGHSRRNATLQEVTEAVQVARADEDRVGVPLDGFFDKHVRRVAVHADLRWRQSSFVEFVC